MIRRFALASALFVAVGSAAPLTAVAATDTSNLSISSSVSNNCIISTTALSFGAYDPIVANANDPLEGTGGTVNTTCTNGANATITLGQGQNAAGNSTDDAPLRQLAAGANRLRYDLYQEPVGQTVWGNTAGTGLSVTGDGTEKSSTVYGTIFPDQNVPAGVYTDTVTATVTF